MIEKSNLSRLPTTIQDLKIKIAHFHQHHLITLMPVINKTERKKIFSCTVITSPFSFFEQVHRHLVIHSFYR
jgi:hypothetical protein